MDTYSFLRELADSWGLLALFLFFLGAWVWAFWPGFNSARADAADIPFRNDIACCCCGGCATPCNTSKEGPSDG